MAAKNDVTGDSIKTKVTSDAYRSNWDLWQLHRQHELDKQKAEAQNGSADKKEDKR